MRCCTAHFRIRDWISNNTDYDATHASRFESANGGIRVDSVETLGHYHINMAALLQLGNWFDYLRENGVYDNTKIILVADHGGSLELDPSLVQNGIDPGAFFPLLMVKDVAASGFTTSSEFMTNADVPSLVLDGLLDHATNPFTGNTISADEKNAHPQYIIISDKWQTDVNNGSTFLPAQWASVKDNWRDSKNWEFYNESIVLDRHQLPDA